VRERKLALFMQQRRLPRLASRKRERELALAHSRRFA
jgi:hypothetical protein